MTNWTTNYRKAKGAEIRCHDCDHAIRGVNRPRCALKNMQAVGYRTTCDAAELRKDEFPDARPGAGE